MSVMENKNIQGQENMATQVDKENLEIQETLGVQEVAANQESKQSEAAEESNKAEVAKQVLEGAGKVGATAAKAVGKAGVATAKVVGKAGAAAVKAGGSAVAGGLLSTLGPILLKILLVLGLAGAAGAAATAVVKFVKEANELKIADTPNVVEEIKKISELTTYTYIEEMVVKDKKAEAKEGGMLSFMHKSEVPDSTYSEVVIITRGVVRAGYDLAKIKEGDLKISNDTIAIVLPATEIFDVIINPSDNDIFIAEGKWSHEEITAIQVDCKNRLLQNANEYGILDKAHEHGKEKVENLFKTFGFNVVEVK